MSTNIYKNNTFVKLYSLYTDQKSDDITASLFPLIYSEIISSDITYNGLNVYHLITCSVQSIAVGAQTNVDEVSFIHDFHFIVDFGLFGLFLLLLVYAANAFTREILCPIEQISAKFIEITQNAFNYMKFQKVSFEDVLIKVGMRISLFIIAFPPY